MRSLFPQKLDSDHIRQGLLNIRNTQLQLLKQLKQQTQLLKSYSPSSTSNQSPKRSMIAQYQKTDKLPQFMKNQKISSGEQYRQEKQTVETRRLAQEINYLRNQNKLLNINFQKLKTSSQFEKQTIRDLQLAFKYSAGIFQKILTDIFKQVSFNLIIDSINTQIGTAEVCRPLIRTTFQHIISLIKQRQSQLINETRPKQKIDNEKDIAAQLIWLKSQVSILINSSSIQQSSNNRYNQEQITKIIKQNSTRAEKTKQYEEQIKILKQQNLQLLSERKQFKKISDEWEKLKANFVDKEKKVIFYAKDMQNRAIKAQNMIKQKEKLQEMLKQNSLKLTSVHSILRQDNDNLRNQITQLQEKTKKKIQLIQKQKQQLEHALRELSQQKQNFTRIKQQELYSLQLHVSELKKNMSDIYDFDKKTKEQNVIHQDIYWRKVNIVRTNSSIDHLWQIKEIQYENIHNILQKIRKI